MNKYEYPFISYNYTIHKLPRFRDYMANNHFGIHTNNNISVDYYNADRREVQENYDEDTSLKITENTQVFYINLDHDKGRKKNIIDMLKKFGFKNYKRFPAVNTKTMEKVDKYKNLISEKALDELKITYKNKERKHHYDLESGAVGCYLSFMNIFKDIEDNSIPLAIIFEDDLNISCNKEKLWKSIKNIKIPEDADMILYNALYDDNIKKGIHKISFFYCMSFTIITLQGAKKLSKYLLPIQVQIDTAISRLAHDKKINLYGYSEPSIKLELFNFDTNIHDIPCDDCDTRKDIKEYKKR